MKINKQLSLSIITSLTTLFISTGCMPKNADGSYNSRYSYDPYNKQKAQKNIHYGNKTTNPTLEKKIENNSSQLPLKNKLLSDKIEYEAKSLLGTKYKYGATGPYQYDCSGFTKHVFSSQGITIPRTSKEQAKVGKYLQYSELKKGDLMFFNSNNSSKISHVGIFIGDGKFIHASSNKGKVVISNANSYYVKRHFKWGRRVEANNHFVRR